MIEMCIGLHVKYPLFLSSLIKLGFFSIYSIRILRYQNPWKSIHWEPSCCVRRDRQTDRHDAANSRR